MGYLFQMLQKIARPVKTWRQVWKPDLNKQNDFETLVLFRNNVT